MKVMETSLEGVLKIEPPMIFTDHRGTFVETYNEALYHQAGITQKFVQDDISVSKQNVLRGLHGDATTWKLVSCSEGEVFLAVVNFDESSAQYLKWETFSLSEENRLQVLVPPNFANGHLVLSPRAIFNYKQTTYYDRAGQFSLKWDDPAFGIDWPIRDPILSERDSTAAYL